MELKHYIEILKRRKWVIIITTAMTVIVVVIGTYLMTPIYEASATLRMASAVSEGQRSSDYRFTERILNTYSIIAASAPIQNEVWQFLGMDGNAEDDHPKIEVEVMPDTELLRIVVEYEDRYIAASAANKLAEVLIAHDRELYTGKGKSPEEILGEQLATIEDELIQARREYDQLVEDSPLDKNRIDAAQETLLVKEETYDLWLNQYYQVRLTESLRTQAISIVEPALPPDYPASPNVRLNIALGFLVGLTGGVGLAFLFENLDTTLYDIDQIKATTELPIIARIPPQKEEHGYFHEAVLSLRTKILALDQTKNLKTIMLTSSMNGEGKSTIVVNLARSLGNAGINVIVVDSDLRRPAIHNKMDIPNRTGLSDILMEKTNMDKTIVESESFTGVKLLTSGPLPDNPSELLGSLHMTELLEELKQKFDMVIMDTAPMMGVTDAAVLAQSVDGVLLVVGSGVAREEDVRLTCQHLADVNAEPLGIIVNFAKQVGSPYFYYQTYGHV